VAEEILFEVDKDGVAVMTLNRPQKYNALTTHMVENLFPRFFREVQEGPAIRVLIIAGAGEAFCAGGDIGERVKGVAEGTIKRKHPEEPLGSFLAPMPLIKKPIIAAINGVAAGIGFSLALFADMRIASNKARFSAAFVRRGMMPDGGMTFTLPLIVGFSKALELAMTGDIISAEQALHIGLVSKVIPEDNLMNEAIALAKKLAAGPPLALAFIKRGMNRTLRAALQESLTYESWGQNILRKTKDHQEGIEAFLQKRDPVFRGE
jgi:2-(1,2-epoxy-1,2-dihydrophenyl)acetyl-CoA isomerase